MKFNFLRRRKVLISFTFLFFLFSLVSAVDISQDNQLNDITGVNIIIPEAPINYSLIPTVNSSDFWDNLDTPANIDHNLFNNLEWSVAGHIIDANINATNYNITTRKLGLYDGQAYVNLLGEVDPQLGDDAILTLKVSRGSSTLTISGDPTIDDWFDECVKSTCSPTFVHPIFSNLTFDFPTQDYLITSWAGNNFGIQSQTDDTPSMFSLFTKKGDGGDFLYFSLFASGTPFDTTNREELYWGYNPTNRIFEISTYATGSGTTLPLIIDAPTLNITNPLYLEDNLHLGDNVKIYSGGGDDVSLTFNTTDFLVFPEVGTSNIFFNFTKADFMDGNITANKFSVSAILGEMIASRFVGYADPDTYMQFQGDNVFFRVGGLEFIHCYERGLGQDELIFNDGGIDIDTRIESNNNANMFLVDAANDCVSIGDNSCSETLDINGNLSVSGIIINSAVYIQASDLIDQSYATANVAQGINVTTVDESNGITTSTTSNGTNFTASIAGVYNIVAQPQVTAGAGQSGTFHMWLRKDTGSGFADVSNSNIELSLSSQEEDVILLDVTLKLNANDKIKLVSSVSSTGIKLDAQTPTGEPVIPSIIFTMYRVGS